MDPDDDVHFATMLKANGVVLLLCFLIYCGTKLLRKAEKIKYIYSFAEPLPSKSIIGKLYRFLVLELV